MGDARESGSRFGDEERLRSAPATRDRGHTEHFSNDEAALLRQLRFGRLPEPIPPEQWVEAAETDAAFEPPRAEHGLGEPYGG